MSAIRLKVCGMRDANNIGALMEIRPDYMGFIFYPKSPRFVGSDFHLPDDFPAEVKKVGVFVNATNEEMLLSVKRFALDYLQLHGNEPAEQCKELKEQGIKLIKVFSVDDEVDFTITHPYQNLVDFFLFDTKGKYYGGNARTFDWNVLKKYDQQVPFFLSGGISPYNVSGIKELMDMNLHAIDINSGVEVSPGMKDIEKIKDIKCEL